MSYELRWIEVVQGPPRAQKDWGTGPTGQRLGGGGDKQSALDAIERRQATGISKALIIGS